ncbi:MAG: AEC family transporter [Roseiarcus sp.]
MDPIVTIILPVFALIGVGYAVTWSGLLDHTRGEALSDFVFVIAIPLLMVRVLATADFSGMSAWRLWFPFFAAFVLSWAAGALVIRRLFGRGARAGLVAGLAAGYGNTTLVGIPLALAAYGAAGSLPMALIIAVQMPVMMTAIAVLMERAERQDGVAHGEPGVAALARSVGRSLASNPIIIGLAAGALWRFSGLPFGGLPGDIVGRLADVASPLALFVLGMTLRRYGVRGHIAAGLTLTALKLVVMPALVLILARAVSLSPTAAKVAVLAAACPTGVTPFLVAARFRTGEGLASNVISLSTIFAIASVAFWLRAVEWGLPP